MSMQPLPPPRSDRTVDPSMASSSSSQQNDEEDEPRLSSAALCISFNLLGGKHCFRPEFTHQCFDGEWIRGYQPSSEVLQQAAMLDQCQRTPSSSSSSDELLLHSSHGHHKEQSTHHLAVSIVLAPSCRTCSVSVSAEKKKQHQIRTRRQASSACKQLPDTKRPRLETSDNTRDDNGEEESCSDTSDQVVLWDDEDDDSDFEVDSSSDTPPPQDVDDAGGRTRQRRMRIEEIVERVSKALPPQCNSNKEDKENTQSSMVERDYLDEPIGTVLKEYQRKVVNEEPGDTAGDFVLCLADGQEQAVADYHSQVQNMALWFIETADGVDLTSNEGGGYWKVLYLFRRHNNNSNMRNRRSNRAKYKYSLVGYMTLFHFLAPFKKPKSGIVMRICQVLVLPPYQRAGHGKMLLGTVHDIANGKYASLLEADNDDDSPLVGDAEIVEINVEDPAPSFVALRNRFDYELLCQAVKDGNPWMSKKYVGRTNPCVSDESFFDVLPESKSIAAGAIAKITPQQVQIAYELYKLEALLEREAALQQEKEHELEVLQKRFRLMVKKRLLKVHREDLGAYPTKQEKQDFLAKVFDETLAHYRSVLGRRRS